MKLKKDVWHIVEIHIKDGKTTTWVNGKKVKR